MSDTIDKEIGAIQAVLEALEPLDEDARSNVLAYGGWDGLSSPAREILSCAPIGTSCS